MSTPIGVAEAAARGARALPAPAKAQASPAPDAPADLAPPDDCGPIPADEPRLAQAPAEPGVQPSAPRAGAGPGAIVPLPGSAAAPDASSVSGEALLVLPKGPDGSVPTEFTLAPGATVASSFFSPVLCATLVRIVGPAGATPEELVLEAPEGAITVPNDRYEGAQETPRPAPAETGGDDPYLPLQWGLARAGAERAWAVTDGAGARVAVLDSAPDAAHPDLAGVRALALPEAGDAPVGVHGTLMAGVVGAVAHNGFGIAGVAPGAELIAVAACRPRAGSAPDECRLFELLRGVDLAWEQGAQVLNLSLVGPPNPLLRKAMDRIDQLGAVVVAAAGNEGQSEPRYPAAYPSVIGVGAVDREGALYARGNHGPWVEIVAPGVEILSTVPGGAFSFGDGTSLAAAHVSGVLALAVAASGGDPRPARAAFFAAAQARSAAPGRAAAPLPDACDVLARLGRPCPEAPAP